jgi:hypothetical protein
MIFWIWENLAKKGTSLYSSRTFALFFEILAWFYNIQVKWNSKGVVYSIFSKKVNS